MCTVILSCLGVLQFQVILLLTQMCRTKAKKSDKVFEQTSQSSKRATH